MFEVKKNFSQEPEAIKTDQKAPLTEIKKKKKKKVLDPKIFNKTTSKSKSKQTSINFGEQELKKESDN